MPDEHRDNSEPACANWKPTALTTAQLNQAVSSLRDLIGARLDAIEKAAEIFSENINRVPTDTQKAVATLQALHEAMFDHVFSTIQALRTLIDEKFILRDKGVAETAALTSIALAAALAASKEAVGEQNKSSALAISKSEASTIKTIDGLALILQASAKAVDDKFSDLKDRLARQDQSIVILQGRHEGNKEAINAQHVSSSFIVSVLASILSFVAVATAIINALRK
jgi:hypothetical protein